jgi:hypothetical protein
MVYTQSLVTKNLGRSSSCYELYKLTQISLALLLAVVMHRVALYHDRQLGS